MKTKIAARVFGYASLGCSLLFWIGLGLSYFPAAPQLDSTGPFWVGLSAIALVLGVVAAVLRSRVSLIAIPLAVITFLLCLIVMAT
jgi:hypothetical protein